jgi:hypothetical protein
VASEPSVVGGVDEVRGVVGERVISGLALLSDGGCASRFASDVGSAWLSGSTCRDVDTSDVVEATVLMGERVDHEDDGSGASSSAG